MLKYFILLLLILTTINVCAQQKYLGFKIGANAATTTAALDPSFVQWGFHAGVYQEKQLKPSFRLRGELLYSQKGWQLSAFEPSVGLIDLSFRLNYVDGMVGLYWNIMPRWAVYPGMQLSVLVEEKTTIQPSRIQVEYEDPSRLEFAPVVGTRYAMTTHWGGDVRFTYSTWSIDGYPAARSAVLMLSLEYTL